LNRDLSIDTIGHSVEPGSDPGGRHVDFGRQLHERAITALAAEFAGVFSRGTIERYVRETQAQMDASPRGRGMSFHRARVDWFARTRLEELVQAESQVATLEPAALFVCVHNAGRSQIAAALTQRLSNGWVRVRSAGSDPEPRVHPNLIAVMSEIGVDLSRELPKPLTDDVVRAADVVVTMGCGDSCPVYPGKRYEDWAIADPDGQPLEVVREIRDEIGDRVRALLGTFTPPIPV
jgi:arsenate reductase